MHGYRSRLTQALSALAPCAIATWVACGGGSTTPNAAAPMQAPRKQSTAASDEPESTTETTGQTCDETCAKAIGDAQLALDRAAAFKGADTARESLAKKAARGFEQAWRICLLRFPDGADLDCDGGPEVVTRLVESWGMTENIPGRVFAQLVALDPRWRPANSPLAASDLKATLGQLATQGEQLAKRDPKAEEAAEALEAAVYAHLALEQADSAGRAAATYRRIFGREHAASATLMAVAVAEHHLDDRANQLAMGSLPRAAAPPASSAARLRVLWGAARARGLLGQGNAVGAQREAASVVEIWKNVKNPGNAVGPVAPLPMLGRERVVDAVGAATFVLAEQHARQASALRPPRYLGPPTHAGVNDFVQNKVATWARSKQEKIAAAIQGYAKTAKIVPVPPGRWIVLGHTRVGELNAELADEILGLSLPAQLAKDDGEREAFERAMRGSAAPAVGAARAAFESCVRLSEQYRLAAGEHQYCRERLNGLPPAE